MKKSLLQCMMLIAALVTMFPSCSETESQLPTDLLTDTPVDTTTLASFYDKYCYGYKVKDTTALTIMGINQRSANNYLDLKEGITYLSGTRNGKLWVAGFETETKEQNFEFVDSKPMDLKYKLHLGYGEYRNVTINETRVRYIKENPPYLLIGIHVFNNDFYNSDAEYITFYTPSSSKTYFTQIFSGYRHLIKWYNNSYLLKGINPENPYETPPYDYVCMSQIGDTIFTIKDIGHQGLIEKTSFPINYKDVITFTTSRINENPAILISKRNISFPYATSTWEILTPIAYWLDDAKYSITKKEINETIWQFTLDLLWYNGKKGNYSYRININTGELMNNEQEQAN